MKYNTIYKTHGHTHNFFDYQIGDCRVICNPGQDTGFNPNLILDI
jgi:predicted phosphodiesterase